jgi:hypothetical protein
MTDPSPLLFFSLGTRSARAQIAGLMIGPVGLPLFAGLILWAMIRSPFPAADLFPAFVALELFLYLGAGLGWAFASALLATAVALGGFFFSMAPSARVLYALQGVLVWGVFWVLTQFDRRRDIAWNRYQEEWDGLELDLSRLQADVENGRTVIEDSQAGSTPLIGFSFLRTIWWARITGTSCFNALRRVWAPCFRKPKCPSIFSETRCP